MHSQVSQDVANRINKAFKHFFRRVKQRASKKGFPRFKTYKAHGSITLPQVVNPNKIGKKTYFPKVGWLNTKYHRKITGIAKTITLKKTKSNKYFIIICCENTTEKPVKTTNKEVGIDLGLNHFVATSNCEFFDHPKPLKKLSAKRRKLARLFSKTKKKSSNRNKARITLARVDEQIANIRDDFSWKLCNTLIKKYGTIYAENLNIKNMLKNHCLAKAINDVSWNNFLQKLSYKAESAGGKVIKVNPRNTSQKCSNCGEIVKKTLAIRTHMCPFCGLVLDRDVNAALNILSLGKIGQELPEFKPVRDITTTISQTLMASNVNETRSPFLTNKVSR